MCCLCKSKLLSFLAVQVVPVRFVNLLINFVNKILRVVVLYES